MFARIPNYVLTTGAIVAVIVLVGLYDNQRAPVADGSVGLVVGVPANQLMTQSGDDIVLPVVLRLINRSEKKKRLKPRTSARFSDSLSPRRKMNLFRPNALPMTARQIRPTAMWKQIPLLSKSKPCAGRQPIRGRRLQIAGQVLEL